MDFSWCEDGMDMLTLHGMKGECLLTFGWAMCQNSKVGDDVVDDEFDFLGSLSATTATRQASSPPMDAGTTVDMTDDGVDEDALLADLWAAIRGSDMPRFAKDAQSVIHDMVI